MQLTIDLTDKPVAYGQRVIAMIEAFYGLQPEAAPVPSVPVPLLPQAAPSTVAADPQPSAPVVTPVSSPEPSVPPVPAVPTVPTATAPTEPVIPSSPAGVALDTDGLPWDARIHSGSKEKNKDGRWRQRRGLNDDALVKRVEAELRAVMAVPLPEVPAVNHLPPGVEINGLHTGGPFPGQGHDPFAAAPAVMPPVPEVPAVPFVPPPPPVAPIPVPAVTIPSPPVAASFATPTNPTTLPELMPRVTGAMATGQIPPTAMLDACKAVGLPDLPSLAHRPDLIPQVWATLKASHPGVWS